MRGALAIVVTLIAWPAISAAGTPQVPTTVEPPATSATPVADAGQASQTEPAKVCVTRTMIGSNLPRKVCRSAAQIQKDRKRQGLPVDPSITLDNFENRAGQN
ncbi:hypothetical protein A6F68_02124 [Tsuneonella dongtanensis]|uniref:Uncharacterized protein n=1 Tax=Tsuneonella dongtanensis TaxID=692370 RepID=A0A1B2AER9_9SPHN|nr:hypothetical protein [Tsuneonella dongtanensis]ANY20626.1 hypothetical protein A6F68_02124 [Tsuneonella dongtanensis]